MYVVLMPRKILKSKESGRKQQRRNAEEKKRKEIRTNRSFCGVHSNRSFSPVRQISIIPKIPFIGNAFQYNQRYQL